MNLLRDLGELCKEMVLGHAHLNLASGMVGDFYHLQKWLQVVTCEKALEALKEKKYNLKVDCGTNLTWLAVDEQEPCEGCRADASP